MEREDIEILLACLQSELLVLAASGQIDLNELAHFELSERGINAKGEQVGLEVAKQDYLNAWG